MCKLSGSGCAVLSLVSTEMEQLKNDALKELSLSMIDILRSAARGTPKSQCKPTYTAKKHPENYRK